MNKPKREPKRMVNFRLSAIHRNRLKDYADSNGISMTNVIRRWIEKFIRPSLP